LDIRVRIFGKTTRRREEEAAVRGGLREQPFNELQAERQRRADQIRVVVGGVRGAALGE
jgi:hypothetical protein